MKAYLLFDLLRRLTYFCTTDDRTDALTYYCTTAQLT